MQRKKIYDFNQKHVEPDNELLLWEEWIHIRNEEITKLAEKLQEPPIDLTMNLVEKVREEKEWKTALEHAQIERKPYIRGNLWEQPIRLKQQCDCMPAYIVQRTAAEMGKPSVVEHISVPKYIQEVEKGLCGTPERVDCLQLDANFLKYRDKREHDLRDKIVKIDPFRPKAKDLFVRGRKPKTPSPKLPPLPDIVTTSLDDLTEDSLCSVYAVRINNTLIIKYTPGQDLSTLELLKQEKWHESCTKWSYYFNVPTNRAGRCKIFLQNLGTVTLRYCWKRIKRPIPFIPEDIYEQVFFFNKNEDVLSPGQSKEIFFTFISNKPGIYCEFWEISFCNICFYESMSEKLRVNLYADSIENDPSASCIRNNIMKLQNKINRRAIYNIVSDIINDAIEKATTIEPQQYPYENLFLEAEMFVLKNPVLFYHQTEVMKMKNLYSEMSPTKTWDLSIGSWRETMMSMEFESRMKYYELLRKSHTELLKPWYEGDDLITQKHRAMMLLLGQMADMFDKKYNQLIHLYSLSNEDLNENADDTNKKETVLGPMTRQMVSNVFYIHAYDYVSTTIEMCAGVLSSLDLNRWIEFDFCQM